MRRRGRILISSFMAVTALAVVAQARPRTLRQFVAQYTNTTGTKLDNCTTCHTADGSDLNPYGAALQAAGLTFTSIEEADSDLDGTKNIEEIHSLTYPGDPADSPRGPMHPDTARADSMGRTKADSTDIAPDTLRQVRPDSTVHRPPPADSSKTVPHKKGKKPLKPNPPKVKKSG